MPDSPLTRDFRRGKRTKPSKNSQAPLAQLIAPSLNRQQSRRRRRHPCANDSRREVGEQFQLLPTPCGTPLTAARSFGERSFRHGAATIVLILVKNDKADEAKELAQQARDAWDDKKLNDELDRALEGKTPKAFP